MMNGAFVHLAFNHVPVLGLPFCLLLLFAAVGTKSRDLLRAACAGLVLVAVAPGRARLWLVPAE